MKKLQLLIGSLFFCLVSVLLVACNEAPPKTITSVTANNLQQFYYKEQEIDFNAVTLTVAYSDNTTKQLTKGEVDIEESAAQEDTEFILHTNGLSSQQTLQEGTYNITCTLIGEQEPRALMTVTVDSDMSHVYDLLYFGAPDFVETYKQNLDKMIGTDDGFALKDQEYVVGDDNPFRFEPNFLAVPIEEGLSEVTNIKVDVTLTEGDTVVGDEVYTFDNATYGIQFKNDGSVVGHTYKLSMKPTDWQKDVDDSVIEPVEFTFTVKDGWNVYSDTPEDLGRMSITDPEMVRQAQSEETPFKRLNSGDHGANFFKEDGSKGYEAANFYEIWNNYFSEKYGQETLKPINGLYLHGNVEVTEKDLPARYRITQAEVDAQTGATQDAVGTARDYSYLYTKYLDDDQSFEFNGNYFNVDFREFALNQSHMNSETRLLDIYKEGETDYGFGYSIAFVFAGKAKGISQEMESASVDMKNVQLIGNAGKVLTSEEDEEVEKSSGSLMMVYSGGAVKVHCENSIVQEALNGFNVEVGWENLNLNNSKVFNCFTAGIYNWGSRGNIITNSVLKNFGGAVIITTSTSQRTGGTEEDSKGQATGEPGAQSSFAIDDKSVTECLISGDEAWYSLNKAQLIATTLTAKNSMWADSNKTILHNGKVNVIMIALDQDQLRADHDYLFSKLYWMNETDGQYAIDQTNRLPMDTATLRQMGVVVAGQGRGIPAVVQDCKGNTAITDFADLPLQFIAPQMGTGHFEGDRCYLRIPVPGSAAAVVAVIGMEDLPPQAN